MALDLLDALTQLRQRRDLRVLVLTGEGSAFCAGGDLKDRFDAGASEASRQRNVLLDALAVLDGFPCPVIAMLNGAALAGGFEDVEGSAAGDVEGVNGRVERDADVALGAEVVNFIGLDIEHQVGDVLAVGQVTVV